MTEQLRVIRTENERVDRHFRAKRFELLDAVGQKIRRVRVRRTLGPRTMVKFFVRRASGDAVVFQPGEFPLRVLAEKGPQVIQRQVVADIAVKIAVSRIARIPFLLAPHLPAGIAIAGESRRTFGCVTRGVDGEPGLRTPEHQPVRIDDEPLQIRFAQIFFDPREIRAFRQPDAGWIAAEKFPVVVAGHHDLRADRLRIVRHERQESVRRRTGDDFQKSRILQPAETRDETPSA